MQKIFILLFCGTLILSCNLKQKQFTTVLTVTDSTFTQGQMDTALTVLKKRFVLNKIKHVLIKADYNNKTITIQSPLLEKELAQSYLFQPGRLMLYECYSLADLSPFLAQADKVVHEHLVMEKKEASPNPLLALFVRGVPQVDYNRPDIAVVDGKDLAQVKTYLAMTTGEFPFDAHFVFKEEAPNSKTKHRYFSLYAVKNNYAAFFASNFIEMANDDLDQLDRPAVSFRFDAYGKRVFSKMTEANVEKSIAMVLDDRMITAPRVMNPITDGTCILNGLQNKAEVHQMAVMLQSGCIPLHLSIKIFNEPVTAE